MSDIPDPGILIEIGEPFAAGYFEEPWTTPMQRWSRAVRRRLEQEPPPPYAGTRLYPSGPRDTGSQNRLVRPSYSFTYVVDQAALDSALRASQDAGRRCLLALQEAMAELEARVARITTPHTIGGAGYTHSIPNYGRVLREGLDAYALRVERGLAKAQRQGDQEEAAFHAGLLDVLAGLRAWHKGQLAQLRTAPVADPQAQARRQRLVEALMRVPWGPATTFFQAVVAYNWVFYADDCDNPGRVDLELDPFYQADLLNGATSHEEAVGLIREFWENADANNGWSAGMGGTDPQGDPFYSDLTVACLEAARHMRRPNLQLHVRRDMPQRVWDAALDTLATGCGLPALYHETAFRSALQEAGLGVRTADLAWRNGGGCTETMIHGRSNVGSLDAGLNLPLVLSQTLGHALTNAPTFEAMLAAYKTDVAAAIRQMVAQVNENQRTKARWRPQPMRSLLVDDCIANGREFNAGGARYNWSVVNVAGLANVVDSMAAIRQVVFRDGALSGAELAALLEENLSQEAWRQRLCQAPRYGNDDPDADALATELAAFVFEELMGYAAWRGGKFLPSCLMFVTYARAGAPVPATPDGRRAGEPIADSAGPHQGRDRRGPTAMLKSVARLPHHLAPGTLVVNVRFSADLFATSASRQKLQALIQGYFDLGGMQLQVNVVDQAILLEALEYPERHQDLVVRVGGYSEYFCRLPDDLKMTIIQRTEHGVA